MTLRFCRALLRMVMYLPIGQSPTSASTLQKSIITTSVFQVHLLVWFNLLLSIFHANSITFIFRCSECLCDFGQKKQIKAHAKPMPHYRNCDRKDGIIMFL